MTITKLKETNGDQVRKLLESNGIIIAQDTKQHFNITCPECEKKRHL